MGSTIPIAAKQGYAPAPIPQRTKEITGSIENIKHLQHINLPYQGAQGVIDATTYFNSKISADQIEDAVFEIFEKYGLHISNKVNNIKEIKEEFPKTFNVDEIINIIEQSETRLNVNVNGIWENKVEHLIDKDKLIEKFKSL